MTTDITDKHILTIKKHLPRFTLGLVLILMASTGVILSAPVLNATTYDQEITLDMTRYYFLFTFQNGSSFNNSITLYTQTKYLFNVTSTDVPHGIDIQAVQFRPLVGQYQSAVIEFTSPTVISAHCKVSCGPGHGGMAADITVVNKPTATGTGSSTVNYNGTTTVTDYVTSKETITTNSTVIQVSNQTITTQIPTTITLVKQLPIKFMGILILFLLPASWVRKRRDL